MLQERRLNSRGEQYVVGPTGTPLTLRDLPPAETNRWVIRRKAEVVAAVRGGLCEKCQQAHGVPCSLPALLTRRTGSASR